MKLRREETQRGKAPMARVGTSSEKKSFNQLVKERCPGRAVRHRVTPFRTAYLTVLPGTGGHWGVG